MLRYAVFAALVAGVGFACVELGARGARSVEDLLVNRVTTGLAALQLDWAAVRADGLRLTLHGHAPDIFARDLALESAQATAPIAVVTDYTTVSLAPPPVREPVAVEILRDERGVTLTGRLSGAAMRAELVGALRALLPELALHDLTGINAARPGRNWGAELPLAALAAARVPNAYVRVTPGEVQVDGSVRDAQHRDEVALELISLAGETIKLTLRLREPLIVVAPYAFAAVKDRAGGIRLEACVARDAEEQARIQTALNRLGIVTGEVRCPVALGGPSGDWGGAAIAGLDALASLPAGRFRQEYRNTELVGQSPTGAPELEAALAGLAAALPVGYGLTGGLEGSGEKSVVATSQRHWMRLTRERDGLTMAGTVADQTARQVVETYAAARFGAGRIRNGLHTLDLQAPAGWGVAALVAIDALSRAEHGSAEVAPGRIEVTGTVSGPAQARTLHAFLAGEAPEDYEVGSGLAVDLPSQVAAMPLTAPRCAHLLSAEVRTSPIAFAPGSAVFEGTSGEVLDRLAAILRRCASGRIEIGGHTDSQGSEGLNERLSLARADAVLDALINRGVALDRLSAQGYGESRPVASNETEAGRALNRRIEFTAIQ